MHPPINTPPPVLSPPRRCCCHKGKRRKTILDPRSRGENYDKVELMPRGQMMGRLMDDSDAEANGDLGSDEEEEDLFDERYLVGSRPKPSANSSSRRILRLKSTSSTESPRPKPNSASAAVAGMILSHSDDEDDKLSLIHI